MSYTVSLNGLNLLENFEGFVPHPYQHPGDVPTIGYGTTFYPNGVNVTLQDPNITQAQGVLYAQNFINTIIIPTITKYITVDLNQNQVDALSDFIYNEGSGAFIGSHLLVQINAGADEAAIRAEFAKWIFVNHKPSDWQMKRRAAEANLYFS